MLFILLSSLWCSTLGARELGAKGTMQQVMHMQPKTQGKEEIDIRQEVNQQEVDLQEERAIQEEISIEDSFDLQNQIDAQEVNTEKINTQQRDKQQEVNQLNEEGIETFSETEVKNFLNRQFDMLNWDEIKSLEEELKESVPSIKDFDLSEQVLNLISGEERFSIEEILLHIGTIFIKEFKTYFKLIIRFILIVILCSILQILSKSFGSKDTAKAAYFVCYALIIFTLAQSLMMLVQLAEQTIGQLYEIIQVTLPTLLAFMAVSGYVTSSSALAPVIIGTFNIMVFLIQKVLLPILVSVIVLQVISTMSEEIKIDKFIDLFYKGMKWGLRGVVILSVSIMGIYKLTLPYIDVAIKKGAVNVFTSFLPVVGDASKGAMEFILACSGLIKNAFAVGVIIWVLLLAAGPLIKIFINVALYQFLGAFIQPLGDKKMTEIAGVLAKGCSFILSSVSIVVLLTIASMIICASIGVSMT